STMSKSLHIVARHANSLEDVETFGKNDPYAQFSLDLEDKDGFKKTSVKKNAGKNVEWNETIILDNYDPARHHTLYVEILDQEKGADAVIGYTAVPLYQAADAPNQSFKAKFDLLNDDGKQKGTVSLTITIIDSSQAGAHITNDNPEVKGFSEDKSEHQKRIKGLKRKEHASDAAAIALGVGAILGAKAVLGGG
ncbi:MAG: C2 domain-containing protein, partial [Benniella sp.]